MLKRMASGQRTFKVIFDGDTTGLAKAVGEGEGHLSKLSGALGKVGTIASGFAVGAGLTNLPGFLMDAARAAAEDEQSQARLQATIRSLGGDFDSQLKAVEAAISAGQKLGFTDDETRDAFDKLALATGDSDEALRRLKLAQDFSRASGKSLGESSMLLGKITDENLQVFKRMGITLPDVANEADVLAAVQGKVAGQSEAYAKSTAGQFAIMQDRLGEAKETIGAALLPVMVGLAGVLTGQIIPAVETLASAFQEHVQPVLAVVVDAIGGSQPVMIAAAAVIGTVLVAAFVGWAIAAGAAAVATIAATAPVLAVLAAIALLTAGIVLLVQHWDEVTAKYPAIKTATDDVKATFQALVTFVRDTLIPAIKAVVDFISEHWGEIKAVIEPQVEAVRVIIETAWDLISGIFETQFNVITGLVSAFIKLFKGDFSGFKDDLVGVATDLKDGVIGAFTAMFNGITGLAGIAFDAAKELGAKMVDGLVDGLGGILSRISDIASTVTEAVKGAVNSALRWAHDNIRLHITMPDEIPDIDWGFPLIQLAKGVRNFAGGMALVGEEGPELVTLPPGADVFPADKTRSMIANLSGVGANMPLGSAGALGTVGMAGGGGITVVQHFHGDLNARSEAEARRSANWMSYGLTAALRARGAA